MTKFTAIDHQGIQHEIDGAEDEALMFILRDDADLPIEGTCGGTASCGTCHIYIDEAWVEKLPAREAHETSMLEYLEHFDDKKSRLSCQVNLTPALEGLRLTLAPEE